MQLPFLVVQEKERTSPEMDAEKGTLFLPSFANLDQLQAFEFAKNRFGVSFDALYKKAKEDGSYDLGVWENARFFVSFSGRELAHVYALDEDFREDAAKALSSGNAATYPMKLWGLAGPSLFVFQGVVLSPENKGAQVESCLVLVELRE
jgi:hypothetical protein